MRHVLRPGCVRDGRSLRHERRQRLGCAACDAAQRHPMLRVAPRLPSRRGVCVRRTRLYRRRLGRGRCGRRYGRLRRRRSRCTELAMPTGAMPWRLSRTGRARAVCLRQHSRRGRSHLLSRVARVRSTRGSDDSVRLGDRAVRPWAVDAHVDHEVSGGILGGGRSCIRLLRGRCPVISDATALRRRPIVSRGRRGNGDVVLRDRPVLAGAVHAYVHNHVHRLLLRGGSRRARVLIRCGIVLWICRRNVCRRRRRSRAGLRRRRGRGSRGGDLPVERGRSRQRRRRHRTGRCESCRSEESTRYEGDQNDRSALPRGPPRQTLAAGPRLQSEITVT